MSSIKASIVKALGGEIPQEKKGATKIEYVARSTSLSAPVSEDKAQKKVDAVDHFYGKFVNTLPKGAADDQLFQETLLADVKTATQEAVNIKVKLEEQRKERQRQINLTKAIKAAESHLDMLSYGIVCKQEEHEQVLAETQKYANANKQYLESKKQQPLDLKARAARQKAALEARKAQAQAAANQGSKQPEATQSKKSEQRQDPKPPVTNTDVNSLSDAGKRNIEVVGKVLVDYGCEKLFAVKKAYAIVTAANSEEAATALTGIPTKARADLLPALVGMNKEVYGPLYATKKAETKVSAPVNNGPSNPMEDEVNPEVTVSAAPSTRDVSPLNNNAGKTQEVLPAVDGKI